MAGIQRGYQPVDYGVQDRRQYDARPVAQADTAVKAPVTVGDTAWRDRMVEGLAGKAAKVLDKATDIEFANLYLEGQQAAGMIESENELQGNPLTRDWKVAGYRDTMGKFALADTEAQFQLDLPKLREKGPEELAAYLERRRSKLVPALSGMSRAARSAAVGQMLLQDRSAQAKHSVEHAKYIVEQVVQAGDTALSVSLQALGNAQTEYLLNGGSQDAPRTDAYTKQLESTAGVLLATWADPRLPDKAKGEFATRAVLNVLHNDSTDLYDYLASNKLPGQQVTLLQSLDGEQQGKLATAYREAKSRNKDKRTLSTAGMMAEMRAQIDAGKWTDSYEATDTRLRHMVIAGDITGEARQSMLNALTDKRLKAETTSEMGQLWLQGRTADLWRVGGDDEKGLKAADELMRRQGFSEEQRLGAYLNAGYNGATSGYKAAGEMLAPSLRRMRAQDGTILEQHKKTVDTILQAVNKHTESGRTWARAALLSGMNDEDRIFTERVLTAAGTNSSYELAVARATEIENSERSMSPAVKAARGAQVGTAAYKVIDGIDGRGLVETLWGKAKQMLPGKIGERAALEAAVNPFNPPTPTRGIFGDSEVQRWYTQRMQGALKAAVDQQLLVSPLATEQEVVHAAMADVASRVIDTNIAPIVVPRGTDFKAAFGVSPADRSMIGPAVDSLLPASKDGSHWRIEFQEGRLLAHEYDQNNVPISRVPRILTPQEIGGAVRSMNQKQQAKAAEAYGAGKRVGYADPSAPMAAGELLYNGENTAGVNNTWMLSFRDNLVRNESVTSKVYDDLSGNTDSSGKVIQTVGVGISSTNDFYPKPGPDGRITAQQMQESFANASNAAAVTGANIAKAIRDDQPTFLLMSELAYQSGPSFMTRAGKTGDNYRAFAEAYKSGDAEAAKAAFKKTAAWFYSDDPKKRDPERLTPRRKHYLKLIDQSLKGN